MVDWRHDYVFEFWRASHTSLREEAHRRKILHGACSSGIYHARAA